MDQITNDEVLQTVRGRAVGFFMAGSVSGPAIGTSAERFTLSSFGESIGKSEKRKEGSY